MKFSTEAYDYINGKKFSNGIQIKVAEKEKSIPFRLEILENFAVGKKVAHIGFTDHMPLIKSKIENGTWLHNRLIEVAKKCIGIDIDSEAVEYIKNNFAIDEIYALDVTKSDQIPVSVKSESWDLLILGEVLEHINNPVLFLEKIRQNLMNTSTELIITVPNAWELTNIIWLKKNTEFINSDHRFWFTPYTLAKVASEAGLLCETFQYVQNYPLNRTWKNLLVKRFPILRETVMMRFKSKL